MKKQVAIQFQVRGFDLQPSRLYSQIRPALLFLTLTDWRTDALFEKLHN